MTGQSIPWQTVACVTDGCTENGITKIVYAVKYSEGLYALPPTLLCGGCGTTPLPVPITSVADVMQDQPAAALADDTADAPADEVVPEEKP